MAQQTQKYVTNETLQVVWSYGAVRIESLEITHQIGEHARVRLIGRVSADAEDRILMNSGLHDYLEIYDSSVNGKLKPLFLGQILQISFQVMHGEHRVTVEAVSHTYDMDTQKKKRSFQHVNQRYIEIFNHVVCMYPKSDFIDHTFRDKQTGKFIMQYEETDWSFLKRLASHGKAPLIPDITSHNPRFWIGIPEGRNQIELKEDHPLMATRRIQAYQYSASSEHVKKTRGNATIYSFEWAGLLDIGDEVIIGTHTCVIAKRKAEMKHGRLIWSYECGPREGYTYGKIHNNVIIGAAINGKIIGVSRQQVKVHLDMDNDQKPDTAQWFPYAAEGNQVWHMMPEIGSKVKLYFPSPDEDEATVIQSVRHEPGANYAEKQQQKMADPGVKTFGNPHGKEFTLGDKELNITGIDKQLYIGMNSYTGINFAGSQQLSILASGSIELSGDHIEINAKESLSLESIVDTLEADEGTAPSTQKEVKGSLGLEEEVNSKSDLIEFSATGERENFEPILSEFEQKVKEHGRDWVKFQKIQESEAARNEGRIDSYKDTAKGLWNFVVDVGDMALTTVHQLTSPLRLQSWDEAGKDVQGLYSSVSGKEVAPLMERNETLKGVVSGISYTWDLITFQKSTDEIGQDVKQALKSAKEGIVDPVVTSFKAPSTSLLTTTKEENYNMGYATGQTDVLVVDAALTVMTDGAALASKARNLGTGIKNFIKDPKKSVMGFLKPGGKKGILGKSGAVGDGRFKTRGSLLEKTIDSLDTAAKKMNRSMMEKAPFHILIKQTTNGINSLEIVKNEKSRFFSKGGEGSSGKKGKNEGTGKPNLSSGDLGELLGSGGNKNVYAYGEDKAVGVLKDGKPQKLITEELGLLNKLDELGLPTVNGRSIFVDGKDALMFDRFAQGSKDIVKLHDGKVQIVGESSLLNQRSIEDLTAIRKIMVEKKIKINDLQFLIGKDGRVVVADPLNVEVGKKVKPSKNNLRMIDLLIESARKNSK
ncbi:hypothetical protein [Paenibacillus azoreducens]|uniref:Type III secretion system effector HopBF1-like domain-containing protein n=1 Tax=Paenibacillus azoreducens TaxID=116718 RepID=A0A919YCH3_9BACL|nr:hypothetical protein [Paenibacillus azoreducens]GIO45982.1 hypothetical protein J34TS1_07470 [Paenibacillus azoreducens]